MTLKKWVEKELAKVDLELQRWSRPTMDGRPEEPWEEAVRQGVYARWQTLDEVWGRILAGEEELQQGLAVIAEEQEVEG